MIVNIPILFYSSGLLVALYFLDAADVTTIPINVWFLSLMKILCWIPIAATLFTVLWDDLPHKRNLRDNPKSHLYDVNGKKVESSSKDHLAFLPHKDFCSEEDYLLKQVDIDIKRMARSNPLTQPLSQETAPPLVSPKASWALVTGASQGIGRAICISLARRNIPVILVNRNMTKLKSVANEIQTNYGVQAIPFQCDLSQPKNIDALIETLKTTTIGGDNEPKTKLIDCIDILINNAGIGDSSSFFGNDDDDVDNQDMDAIERLVALNILGTTKLTRAIGKNMVHSLHHRNQGARIAFVSSIMGAFPGVPGSSVYAATKAYQRSLCASLGRELDAYPRCTSILCGLPGGVRDTNFARTSHMTESAIFHLLPGWGLALQPMQVAEAIVKAAIDGNKRELYIGWFYNLGGHFLMHMVPSRLLVILSGIFTGHKSAFEFHSTLGKLVSKLLMPNSIKVQKKNENDKNKHE